MLAASIIREKVVRNGNVRVMVLVICQLDVQSVWKDHISDSNFGNCKHVDV